EFAIVSRFRTSGAKRTCDSRSRRTLSLMSWRMGWSVALRLAAGLAAIVFTAASSLYAPIGLGTQSPAGMEVRTQAVWVLLVASAAATWLVAILPALRSPRLLSSATAGFNLIWIFSFAGPPVVLASLAAICAAT